MTTYVNGFNSGSNGSNATTSSIASSGYGYSVGGTATATFSAADAIEGALAIEFARASNTRFIFTNGALATLDISFSLMLNYKTAIPNSNDYLFDARTSGGSLVRMLTPSSGVPFVQISGVTQSGSIATAALVHDTQYRLDVRIHVNGSTGFVIADFFNPFSNVPLSNLGFALTGKNLGTSNLIDVFLGPSGTNSVTVGTTVLDLPRINDAQSSSYWGSPTGLENGAANLTGLGTLVAAATITRPGAANLLASSTLVAISTGIGAIYDDSRYTYDSGGLEYDGGGLGPGTVTVTMTATSWLTADASTLTPSPPPTPILGVFALTVAAQNEVNVSVGQTGAVSLSVGIAPSPGSGGGGDMTLGELPAELPLELG